MTTFLKAGILAATLTFGVGMAQAATITYDFTKANSGTRTALSYTVDGVTLDVTTTGGNGKVQTWTGGGLGAPTDSHHQVDSYGIPETINFSFSAMVKLLNVTFKYVDSWDRFALSQDGTVLAPPSPTKVMSSVDVSPYTSAAQLFGVGAVDALVWGRWNPSRTSCDWTGHKQGSWRQYSCFSAFKIASVTVDYTPPLPPVPLPAAGWMLLAGLGGLAALRRRRA